MRSVLSAERRDGGQGTHAWGHADFKPAVGARVRRAHEHLQLSRQLPGCLASHTARLKHTWMVVAVHWTRHGGGAEEQPSRGREGGAKGASHSQQGSTPAAASQPWRHPRWQSTAAAHHPCRPPPPCNRRGKRAALGSSHRRGPPPPRITRALPRHAAPAGPAPPHPSPAWAAGPWACGGPA